MNETATLHCGEVIQVDRQFAYDLLAALSELHGRHCEVIGNCGDMEKSTTLAKTLEAIVLAYNDVEQVAANFDVREPNLLEC